MSSTRSCLLAIQQDRAQELIARAPMHVEGWQSSGGEEEWLAALALRGGIVRNLLVRPLALQRQLVGDAQEELLQSHGRRHVAIIRGEQAVICLLYTSDAADEEDSVDLGGRRI